MCNKRVSRRFDVLSQLQKDNIEMYYEVGSVLGSGKFATVRVCRNKQTSKTFAGKFVRRRQPCRTQQQMCQPRSKGDVQTEINILQSLSLHENIIRLFEVYEGPLEVVLMLELISGGELFHYLVKRERVSEDEGVFFLKQVLQATQYMHAKNIVHLDLKPENLMLESEVSKKLKIIDFGLSVQLSESVEWRELTGTPEFVAPEVINFDPVTAAADIWSIGVIAFITLSGFSPFLADDKQATLANVSRAEYEFDENYFKTTSHLAKEFIQNLLVKNPRKRPTATECLEHPWINPKDINELANRRKSRLNITNLKSFMARRRWMQSFHAISLFNHLSHKVRSGKDPTSSSSAPSPLVTSSSPSTTSSSSTKSSTVPSASTTNLLRVKKVTTASTTTLQLPTKQLHTTNEGKIRLSVLSGYDSE